MTREEAIDFIRDGIKRIDKYYPDVKDGREALEMAIKALEQCEVWNGIHGQVVAPKGTFDRIWNDADKEEQEPCEDAISREWLKAAIHNFYRGLIHTPTEEDIQAYIDAAPFVNPQEQKTGHWITHIKSDKRNDYWSTNPKCSKCGGEPYYNNTIYNYKFCPYCGAKMESEE